MLIGLVWGGDIYAKLPKIQMYVDEDHGVTTNKLFHKPREIVRMNWRTSSKPHSHVPP